MARARNIKPKFFQNDELGELDPLARLLFIGLWTVADFRGCLEFRPKRLKAQLLPYDDCDLEQLVKALDNSGFIAIYTVQGQQYIKVLKFEEHQNPHKNERESGTSVPDIDKSILGIEDLEQDGKDRDKDGTTPADSLLLNPDSLNLNPEPGLPSKASTPTGVDVASNAGNVPAKGPVKPDCPHQEIIALYHEVLPQCPQVRDWTSARQTQLRARWNESPDRQSLDYWRRFFEYVKTCPFLVGAANTTPGRQPFFADLEWLTKSANFTKVREQRYEQ